MMMAVYVDKQKNPFRGMVMCHMLADTEAELHAMADRLGARRAWYQSDASTPHYDIPWTRRAEAVEAGAVEVDRRQTVQIIRRIRSHPDSFYGRGFSNSRDHLDRLVGIHADGGRKTRKAT